MLRIASLSISLLALLVLSSCAKTKTSIKISNLTPAYSAKISDYTTRCSAPVKVSVKSSRSEPVSVDRASFKSGAFSKFVLLKPGQGFSLRVGNGKKAFTQWVRCLPDDFPLWQTKRSSGSTVQLLLLAPTMYLDIFRLPLPKRLVKEKNRYVIISDGNGVPVWWYKDPVAAPWDVQLISSSSLAWSHFKWYNESSVDAYYQRFNWEGKKLGRIQSPAPKPDYREAAKTVDGNYFMISSEPRDCPAQIKECVDLSAYGGPAQATVVDSVIEKVSPSGKWLWKWSTRNHLDPSEAQRWIRPPRSSTISTLLPDGRIGWRLFHINAVKEHGSGILFSARHGDAIYRIKQSSGQVDWKIGGTETKQSIPMQSNTSRGMPFVGPHDIRVLPDGTFTAYDNGIKLRAPTAVHFRVQGRIATQLARTSDAAADLSICCGSAQLLQSGNWLINQGGGSRITEISVSGSQLFSLTLPDKLFSYRVQEISQSQLAVSRLRSGMNILYPR